jgi:hypothetical protein
LALRSAESVYIGKTKPADLVLENLKVVTFPNPHQGNFILKIESPEDGMASIQIVSSDGSVISVKHVMLHKGKSNQIPFSNMRETMLFYRIIIGNYSAKGKIISQN